MSMSCFTRSFVLFLLHVQMDQRVETIHSIVCNVWITCQDCHTHASTETAYLSYLGSLLLYIDDLYRSLNGSCLAQIYRTQSCRYFVVVLLSKYVIHDDSSVAQTTTSGPIVFSYILSSWPVRVASRELISFVKHVMRGQTHPCARFCLHSASHSNMASSTISYGPLTVLSISRDWFSQRIQTKKAIGSSWLWGRGGCKWWICWEWWRYCEDELTCKSCTIQDTVCRSCPLSLSLLLLLSLSLLLLSLLWLWLFEGCHSIWFWSTCLKHRMPCNTCNVLWFSFVCCCCWYWCCRR